MTYIPGLDEHLEREAELAAELEARGNVEARRPDAVIREATFESLRLDEFITAEPEGDKLWGTPPRFVRVVRLRQEIETRMIVLTFETPEPIGVGMEDHWIIERDPGAPAYVDARQP